MLYATKMAKIRDKFMISRVIVSNTSPYNLPAVPSNHRHSKPETWAGKEHLKCLSGSIASPSINNFLPQHRWNCYGNSCTCYIPQQCGHLCIHAMATLAAKEGADIIYDSLFIDDVWRTENYRSIHDGTRKYYSKEMIRLVYVFKVSLMQFCTMC